MDSNEHNKVIAFDTLFCTNHIQMLKIMLSYMDNQTQKFMAVFIKFLELNYTINYFKRHPFPLCGCAEKENSPDIFKMCSDLLPYCTEKEKRQLEQIRGIIQSMEMYREMSKTMDLMKDFMPDMSTFAGNASNSSDAFSGNDGGFDMMGMLMNMLTPEQKQMFEMFGGNQHAE
ncbi:MAG: hypothetical protein SOV61_09825 [Lachnospiraceae bacterium]|nr:hypothetical protein [Lachnospiraceae bacterium]